MTKPSHKIWVGFVLVSVFATLLATFRLQYQFAKGDQGLQLAWMQWYQNPDMYPGDAITIAFQDYHSLLLRAVSGLIALFPADSVFLSLHLLSLFSLMLIMAALAHYLTGSWLAACVCAILAGLVPWPALAGSPLVNDNFVPSSVAVPMIVLAMIFYFSKRWPMMGGLLGLTALMHPLEGAVAFAALFVAALIYTRGRDIKRLGLSIILFILIASPIIGIMLKSGAVSGGDQDWIEVLRWRSPHHIFPLSWSVRTTGSFGLMIAAGIWSVSIYKRHRTGENSTDFESKITALAVAVGLMAVIGVMFTEVWPLAIVLKAQPLRSANLLTIALMPFFSYALICPYYQRKEKSAEIKTADQVSAESSIVKCSYAIMLCYCFLTLVLGHWVLTAEKSNYPDAWREAQAWARENTRPEQRFLCLPPLENFRTLSQRPEFGSWKDGTLANFSPEYVVEWRRRMELLGMTWTPEFKGYGGAEALARLWGHPTAEQLRRVLDAEPCDFIVTRFGAPLPESTDWTPVFQNTSVIIFEVQLPPNP